MLIFPIVNNRHVMNVELRLKDAEKIRQGVRIEDAKESEIIVNSEKYSNSSYFNSKGDTKEVDFIRSKSILYPRKYFVTTKTMKNSSLYDVYTVSQPPRKASSALDALYSKAITDLRSETPGVLNNGRYVSFEDLGLGKEITDEKIDKLKQIITEVRDQRLWPKLFSDAGIAEFGDMVNFLQAFECTIISDTTIPEESLQDTLKALSVLKTRDYKNLNKYYQMAKSNSEIYTRISYISQIMYGRPLALIHTPKKSKQYIKKKDETSYAQAA